MVVLWDLCPLKHVNSALPISVGDRLKIIMPKGTVTRQ